MARDLSPGSPEDVGLSRAGLERIDAELKGYVDRGDLSGVVTLVARHGKVVHTSAIGTKDLATGEPMAMDTMFRIYSMTKPVTGVAMSILHGEGLWSPDDPIAKHLPAFADVKVFTGMGADGKPRLEDPRHAPTLAELLTHTAGLSYGFDQTNPLDQLYIAADVWRSGGLAEMARRIGGLPLAYQPGTKWVYSIGMDVQGAIIEALSGQSLPQFMQERIFGPLGMVDTAFHLPPDKAHRLAGLYRPSKSRGLVPIESPILPLFDRPPALASGGGGLISTAADYARFAQMLLNGGELEGVRIAKTDSLKLQMTNHLSAAIMAGGYGVGLQQIRPGYGHGFDGAVFTNPKAAGVPVGEGTYQWDGAAGTWFWVDPVHDLLYVGLIQRMAEVSPHFQKITQTLMADAIL